MGDYAAGAVVPVVEGAAEAVGSVPAVVVGPVPVGAVVSSSWGVYTAISLSDFPSD